jgi:DNA helicase-2/ATP-dependent DNA helicase PcrA
MTFPNPTGEQQEVLDLGLISMRIRAGAGTGKTTTVAMVIANLISRQGIEPEQVLGITFTNKAASELADRVRSAVGGTEPARQVEVHTYHGFAAQILSEFGVLAGVDPRVKVITPTFARQLLAETFLRTDYRYLDITLASTHDRIRKLGDRLGDHLLEPETLLDLPVRDDVEGARHEMATTLVQYGLDKRRLGVVDYGDLVTLSTRILTTHPELATVVRDRYRLVVLDEYQDTNPAQRVLLTTIFGNGFPVVAVGDEDQTIYEWRGASAENFERFAEHFRSPDGSAPREMGLRLSRRSGQAILDVANAVRAVANPGADWLMPATDSPGEVTTYWASTAIEEAEWIADTFEGLRETGVPWKEMAVLFRKNKDFAVMVDVLTRHDIPLEVANVGGLMSVPEVADLRAWLTVLERPEDSASLTQILFGSRYRLGLADLARMTRHIASLVPDDPDAEAPEPLSLIDALEDVDGLDLRPEAAAALRHFRDTYRHLLLESQGIALVELCRMILDVTGAWRDIEALPRNQRLTARLNLHRMLDLAEDWSPLKGRPSLTAFLDYLGAMEEEPADELDSARLSGEDAVTLVTVHRAKGLEWDTVAIPAVTERNFPSVSAQFPNPVAVADHVPADLRLDDVLAGAPDDVDQARAFFRDLHARQEWRVAYVAVTRAKRRLMVSGAHWYGLPEPGKNHRTPSPLWDLVDALDVTRCAGVAELVERPALLWLGTRPPAPDPLFPGGWDAALREALARPETIDELAVGLGMADEHRALARDLQGRLFALAEPEIPTEEARPAPVSVTGLVTHAQCPKRYFWSAVDPLPRRRSLAATRGTQVHRMIELHQRGEVPLDLVDPAHYDAEEPSGPVEAPRAYDTYLGSRFASKQATLVEAPFSMVTETGVEVRGRVDAIYADGRRWEIVDFKSGNRSEDASRIVQLQAYAVAAHDFDFGIPAPESVAVTFAYLGGGGEEVSHDADAAWLAEARRSIASITGDIAGGRFPERPGSWCAGCDFLRFCGPGKDQVG